MTASGRAAASATVARASAATPFVVFRDQDGRRHALRRQTVTALVEAESGGTAVLLHGGRVIVLADDLDAALLMFS